MESAENSESSGGIFIIIEARRPELFVNSDGIDVIPTILYTAVGNGRTAHFLDITIADFIVRVSTILHCTTVRIWNTLS